jgi:hypothetical protein
LLLLLGGELQEDVLEGAPGFDQAVQRDALRQGQLPHRASPDATDEQATRLCRLDLGTGPFQGFGERGRIAALDLDRRAVALGVGDKLLDRTLRDQPPPG